MNLEGICGELLEGPDVALVVDGLIRDVTAGRHREPDEGTEYVAVVLAVQNTTDEFLVLEPHTSPGLQDTTGRHFAQELLGGEFPGLVGGSLAPGEVERGALFYEVPQNGHALEFTWWFDLGRGSKAVVDLEESQNGHTLRQELRVDPVEIGDGAESGDARVTVHDVRFPESIGSVEPAPANEYVVVELTVENRGDDPGTLPGAYRLKDSEGWGIPTDRAATRALEDSFQSTPRLSPGESRRGELAYEHQADAWSYYWAFDFRDWTGGDKHVWQLR